MNDINRVCFIGSGTMGCFNSLLAALVGYDCVLFDIDEESFKQVPQAQQDIGAFLVGSGFCTEQAIAEAQSRIRFETDLSQAVAGADLISESVPERLSLKQELHQQLESICPEHCILTTNTSNLMVSEIQAPLASGKRFAALHSHLGALLIDIVAGPRTDASTVDTLKRYVLSLNAVPLVLKKENPGYVLNAILGPLLTMSMMLVIEKAATIEDLDAAWLSHRKGPMGPFAMMDLFGLDVIADSWQQPRPDPAMQALRTKILGFITPYIERGDLGMKSKKGFYQYPDPAYQQAGFVDPAKDLSGLDSILVATIIENAIIIANKAVAEPKDIDRAWMTATYLDIGPFGLLDAIGLNDFLTNYHQLVAAGLFTPAAAAIVDTYLQPKLDLEHLGEKTKQGFYSYPNPLFQEANFLLDT
ncbi:3-hydroxyacyl-CoA dehydrogenase [Oceanicoccus sagamiensis]|uniref:3-hydroxyacyl-CoA dehydrogenase n=1 Tax=Oceanicoccus sagamiensis TaxID=716816 RepID=UPI001981F6AD|nr:3-hydroxyacyl-CoA dehydrogenase NAD-binding domain-containing protein [Oceanicoccus sagamiensis]